MRHFETDGGTVSRLLLSPKYKAFLRCNATAEFLEGTTAAGKTTVGVFKFILKCAQSPKKMHILSGLDSGTIEKNIICKDLGVLDNFGGLVTYNPNGKGAYHLPHILLHTANGDKVIYVLGYDNKARWKKALGGQYGCLYIDEINIADMDYVREAAMRCDYLLATLNPDDPALPVYAEYVNHARPLAEWQGETPAEILEQLSEEPKPGWVHWFFSFAHNAALSPEKIMQIKQNVPTGTKLYKNKILGLRGRATGLVFDLQQSNIITKAQAKWYPFRYLSIGCDTSYSSRSHDRLTFEAVGITTDKKCILLMEETHNNAEKANPFAPSDVIPLLHRFAERVKLEYGFARTIYIDSADAGTIQEAKKYKTKTGCIYDFTGAWKKTSIITRIQLQQSWMKTGDFLIVDTCKDYITELNTYSYDEKGQPEDGHDHSINGCQYAWLPYKQYIGNYEQIREVITDA